VYNKYLLATPRKIVLTTHLCAATPNLKTTVLEYSGSLIYNWVDILQAGTTLWNWSTGEKDL